MKKILLLGATGTAGSAIAKKLLSDTAYHITLFARHAGEQYSENSRTAVINGDAENMEDLKKRFRGRTWCTAPYPGMRCLRLPGT